MLFDDTTDLLLFLAAFITVVVTIIIPLAVSMLKYLHNKHFELQKLPPAEITQYQMYVAIRKGIDYCTSIHEMQDYYRAIVAYGKTYPDAEGRKDTAILTNEYNIQCARLLSPLKYHQN